MSQNSITLPTSGTVSGLQMTQDTNNALDTLNTLASGASPPGSPEAGQLWHDTTNNMIKLRSLDNTTWITLFYLNETSYLAGPSSLGQISGSVNRVLNGGMVIDQQNEGASYSIASGGAAYTLDQWEVNLQSSTASGVSVQRVTDAPSGFSHSLKVTVGTGASSVASGDYLYVFQPIEGSNMDDFGYGTASASPVSLSFWVKSSVAGTYAVALQNAANNRANVSKFTITNANTWQQIVIANIPGDVTGTWNTNASIGLILVITIAAGSGFQTLTPGSWQGTNVMGASTQTNTVLTTNSATFQLTGVMFNPGVFCSTFEKRLYQSELMALQRYYEKSFPIGTAVAQNAGLAGASAGVIAGTVSGCRFGSQSFVVRKRAAPTMVFYNPSAANANAVDTSGFAITSFGAENIGDNAFGTFGNSTASASTRTVSYHWTANARM